MSDFTVHDIDSAPEKAKPLLENSKKSMGMVPSLHGVMAEAPELLEGYQTLHGLFTNTSLNASEQSVVWLSISVENECHYCVPSAQTRQCQQGGPAGLPRRWLWPAASAGGDPRRGPEDHEQLREPHRRDAHRRTLPEVCLEEKVMRFL